MVFFFVGSVIAFGCVGSLSGWLAADIYTNCFIAVSYRIIPYHTDMCLLAGNGEMGGEGVEGVEGRPEPPYRQAYILYYAYAEV